jgi:hypothetical protein
LRKWGKEKEKEKLPMSDSNPRKWWKEKEKLPLRKWDKEKSYAFSLPPHNFPLGEGNLGIKKKATLFPFHPTTFPWEKGTFSPNFLKSFCRD